MPYTIRLKEYSGETVDEIEDDDTLTRILSTHFGDPNTVVLRFLNRYDDSMLNSFQMEALIIELEAISNSLTSANDRAAVQRLIDVADQGAEGRPRQRHRQLWFIGD